ncbi:MAG: hypothetical protein APG08_01498 [Candidatus Methanofastidiosum methylothiophilum]|jgi:hypothetical protein|uniref:Uncharacterized protein n=1 Tax=Candidatus Methanofastidiosum methylothiophilum TaxID=1705564 RepID=A0A150JF56_9EURY|nr:MAG: hypothetical protein APG08_01498 [Candidatus Methanofastidiosum methylthiophilus]MBP7237265.1 hypothetical protein [Petrotogaceae bacterium]KYC55875.1 MAG: hypothetical protein APG09_01533 [Candidatus Methanofastidiosum methylthiophilus]HPO26640.1 hypothetical protein [Petrotogaceae bacterium]HPX15055.1 hypothetical protein [Petrotogaceae bacterium]
MIKKIFLTIIIIITAVFSFGFRFGFGGPQIGYIPNDQLINPFKKKGVETLNGVITFGVAGYGKPSYRAPFYLGGEGLAGVTEVGQNLYAVANAGFAFGLNEDYFDIINLDIGASIGVYTESLLEKLTFNIYDYRLYSVLTPKLTLHIFFDRYFSLALTGRYMIDIMQVSPIGYNFSAGFMFGY